MQGWIIDGYADLDKDSIVLWFWSRGRALRLEDASYRTCFYAETTKGSLRELRERLQILDGVEETEVADVPVAPTGEVRRMLRIVPRRYADLQRVAHTIDNGGGYHDVLLYDVDVRLVQRYLADKGLFPCGLLSLERGELRPAEEQFALDYDLPPLRVATLDVEIDAPLGIPRQNDTMVCARLDDAVVDGGEVDILEGLNDVFAARDPDVLLTDRGDSFLLPYLYRKAAALGVDLQLGRDPQKFVDRRGKSYFTYGRIVYKPGRQLLRGRLHLDRGHFTYRESGLAGLFELSRLSLLPPQEQDRLTPGTAFSAMQVNLMRRDGCAVLWKKNRPEDFKTADLLSRADRGGLIFDPEVGLHEGIVELDYASLYPCIMHRCNISAETLNCACCVEDGLRVPELGYHTCARRRGIVPRVLKPLIERKRYYKRVKRDPGPLQEIYEERDTILKWVLVTSFGYQGYKNARFGRIECHEAINAYARDLLLRSMEIAEAHDYDVIHGIVDSLWLKPRQNADDVRNVAARLATATGMPVDVEGTYRWLLFLPCKTTAVGALNRYYGCFEDGTLKVRGIEVRRHDTTPFVAKTQQLMLDELAHARSAAEFRERVPRALAIADTAVDALKAGRIPLADLVLTKNVAQRLEDYVVLNAAAAALKQMHDRGFTVEPGESVRYVVLDERSRNAWGKVRAADFLQGDERPDVRAYARLLARSVETMFSPLGFTEDGVLARWSIR